VVKRDLFQNTRATVVDMETATLAGLAKAAGLPFLAIRAISDEAAEDLAIPFAVSYDMRKQRPRPVKVVLWLLTHPARVPAFIRFLGALNRAERSLALALRAIVASYPGSSSAG
jgi:adenosylhomocysteine nucleosidase